MMNLNYYTTSTILDTAKSLTKKNFRLRHQAISIALAANHQIFIKGIRSLDRTRKQKDLKLK